MNPSKRKTLGAEVGFAAAPRADQGDVQLIAGSIRAEKRRARKQQAGPGDGERLEELASFHK